MQQDIEFSEDSLAISDAEQAASEVTCTDYLKQFEVDNVSQDSVVEPHQYPENIGPATASTLNADAPPLYSNTSVQTDTYMWKVVHKRDRPDPSLNLEAGFWSGARSSQQSHNKDSAYIRNWQLMQSFFLWDLRLPSP